MLARPEVAALPNAGPPPAVTSEARAAIDKLAQLHSEAIDARRTTITSLAADWRAAYAQAEAEDRRLNEAQTAAGRLYPPRPFDFGYQPRWTTEQAALDLWQEQVAAIESSFGIPGLSQATNAAFRTAGSIAAEVLAMRPATAAEAALKYGILLERTHDGSGGIDDARPAFDFLADLEHLALLER